MEKLPSVIGINFGLITLLTVYLFYRAANNSKVVPAIFLSWLALQAVVSLNGFYLETSLLPPRFILLIGPPLLFILILFVTLNGKRFIDSLNIEYLTLLHIVRIPVELILFSLFTQKMIPGIMTFEGRNFDLLSGLSAPLIYYFGFVRKKLNRKIILVWNVLCLGLLINIAAIAVFSAPFPFQKFGFDQPNVAVLYFPFVWLPGCVVPLVLFSHLTVIRQLLKK